MIMDNYNLDITYLEKRMSTVNSWEDWEVFEKEFFDDTDWPEKDIDEITKESEEKAIHHNGLKWKHITVSYELPSEYYYLYEYCSDYIFKKLEPEQHDINTNEQGKWCAYCKVYTDNSDMRICPFCCRKLFNMQA